MREFWGGLLASTARGALGPALGVGYVDPSLCSIEDGGDGGAGGGAAGLLEDDPDAAAAAAAAAAGGGGSATGEVPDWAKGFSGEKTGDELSNQEYIAKKGFADPDALVKSYREAERQLRESGKVKIPGENASDEEKAAYREAVGAPKEAAGYEVVMPEEAKDLELDATLLDPLKEIAFKHGVSNAAFKELSETFIAQAVADEKAEVAKVDTDAAAKVKEWGANAPQRKEEFRRGAELLGLTAADIKQIERSDFGTGRTLDLFAKIGQLAGEDFFATGDPATKFGVANLEQAQAKLDALSGDNEFTTLLNAGDKGAAAKWNLAIEAVATFKDRESRKR